MLRFFTLVLLTLTGLFSACWSVAFGFDEVAEFLRHRNVLVSVEFNNGSNMLTDSSRKSLDRVAEDMLALLNDAKVLRIEGHASPGGEEEQNLILSMQRALSVQEYLQQQYGLELDLYINGYGSGRAPAKQLVQLAFYDDTLGLTVADIDSVVTK